MVDPTTLTNDQIVTIVLSLLSGIVGSIIVLIASNLREDRKDKESSKRLRAIVKFELTAVRDLIQKRMLDTHQSGMADIIFIDTSIEVQRADQIIESLQYPVTNIELKLKAFNVEMLSALQDVYLQILTLKAHRGYTAEHVFEYDREFLKLKVEAIDKVIEKLK